MASTQFAQLEPVYKYYLVTPSGVTHRVLDEAEDLATNFLAGIRRIQVFADEKRIILAAAGEMNPAPQLLAKADSIIDSSVRKKRPDIESHFMRSYSMDDLSSFSPKNSYDIACTGKGGVCCDWSASSMLLKRLTAYRGMAYRIVNAAQKAHVSVPSSANDALVDYGSGRKIEAQGYKIFTNWVYRSPINPENGRHFIPPQSVKIGEDRLDEFKMGLPLEDWRSDHTRVWDRVEKLKSAMPKKQVLDGGLPRPEKRGFYFLRFGDTFPF